MTRAPSHSTGCPASRDRHRAVVARVARGWYRGAVLRLAADVPELLEVEPDPRERRRALAFLELAHHRLGGDRVLRGFLSEWSKDWPARPMSFLDAGTGGGALTLSLIRWSRAAGRPILVTAVERSRDLAEAASQALAGAPEAVVVQGDLFDLSPSWRFDYVVSSLVLHHLPDERLVEALRAFDRLARRGVLAVDLERSWAALACVRLATALLGDRLTRHDGPLSVRRAFRAAELDALGRRAGLPYLRARRHPFFRVSLAGEKRHA